MKKLLGLTIAILMIAAVACSSPKTSDQPDPAGPVATSAPAAVTNGSGASSGTEQVTGAGASNSGDSGSSGAVAPDEPDAVVTGPTVDVAFEQATGALFLEMISPETDELFVAQSSYEFSGRTTVDALLSVNDTVLDVDEQGRFAFMVDLEEGPNVIEVVASNGLGEQYDEVLLVIYEPA